MSHNRRNILLIFNLFITGIKWAISFGTFAKRRRHAMSTLMLPTLDLGPRVSIVQPIVTITDNQHAIARTYVCKTRINHVGHIPTHVTGHEKWRPIAKFWTTKRSRFGYGRNGPGWKRWARWASADIVQGEVETVEKMEKKNGRR